MNEDYNIGHAKVWPRREPLETEGEWFTNGVRKHLKRDKVKQSKILRRSRIPTKRKSNLGG